ncbi:MAG: Na/Pi cotransporter family protein [Syntrophales bacterium]|nr:Na/Pi cotransporter family protein [Syntrophales bacterium]
MGYLQHLLTVAVGVTLFLYGMANLSAGIQRLFTTKIRKIILYAVKRPILGLLTGIGATLFFQSSSATTTITVGMVGAGLISLYHALAILLGADIGSTMIIQLITWKVTDIAPIIVLSGGTIFFLTENRWRKTGEMIFHFGLIFFGLALVGKATEPLRHSPMIVETLTGAPNPWLGFILGLIIAALVHASAVPIGVAVILAQQSLISIEMALPIVFGANVGTTITAIMAGFVSGREGQKVAMAHFLFKSVGAVVSILAMVPLISTLKHLTNSVPQQITLGHFFFNAIIVLIFFPALSGVSQVIERILPKKEETISIWPEYLSEEALDNSEAALDGVRKELIREITLTEEMYHTAVSLRKELKREKVYKIMYLESVVNELRDEIVEYLRTLACRVPALTQSRMLFAYTATADDIERMANHIVVIARIAELKAKRKIPFSTYAEGDLEVIETLVGENIAAARQLIERENMDIVHALTSREDKIDLLVKEARDRHLIRFHKRICQPEAGPLFVEMLIRLERISDHCQNIAEQSQEIF